MPKSKDHATSGSKIFEKERIYLPKIGFVWRSFEKKGFEIRKNQSISKQENIQERYSDNNTSNNSRV